MYCHLRTKSNFGVFALLMTKIPENCQIFGDSSHVSDIHWITVIASVTLLMCRLAFIECFSLLNNELGWRRCWRFKISTRWWRWRRSSDPKETRKVFAQQVAFEFFKLLVVGKFIELIKVKVQVTSVATSCMVEVAVLIDKFIFAVVSISFYLTYFTIRLHMLLFYALCLNKSQLLDDRRDGHKSANWLSHSSCGNDKSRLTMAKIKPLSSNHWLTVCQQQNVISDKINSRKDDTRAFSSLRSCPSPSEATAAREGTWAPLTLSWFIKKVPGLKTSPSVLR